MAKFYGKVGFAESVKTGPGVYEEAITERSYFGDVIRNSRQLAENDQINPDVTVGNSLRIMDDGYASEHIQAMRYVEWAGELWVVDDVTVERPRLTLRLGGVYNGPTPSPPESP